MGASPEQQERTAFARNLIDEFTRDGFFDKDQIRENVRSEYRAQFGMELGRNYHNILREYEESRKAPHFDDSARGLSACVSIMADHMEAIKNGHPSPYTKEEVEEARTNYRELKKGKR